MTCTRTTRRELVPVCGPRTTHTTDRPALGPPHRSASIFSPRPERQSLDPEVGATNDLDIFRVGTEEENFPLDPAHRHSLAYPAFADLWLRVRSGPIGSGESPAPSRRTAPSGKRTVLLEEAGEEKSAEDHVSEMRSMQPAQTTVTAVDPLSARQPTSRPSGPAHLRNPLLPQLFPTNIQQQIPSLPDSSGWTPTLELLRTAIAERIFHLEFGEEPDFAAVARLGQGVNPGAGWAPNLRRPGKRYLMNVVLHESKYRVPASTFWKNGWQLFVAGGGGGGGAAPPMIDKSSWAPELAVRLQQSFHCLYPVRFAVDQAFCANFGSAIIPKWEEEFGSVDELFLSGERKAAVINAGVEGAAAVAPGEKNVVSKSSGEERSLPLQVDKDFSSPEDLRTVLEKFRRGTLDTDKVVLNNKVYWRPGAEIKRRRKLLMLDPTTTEISFWQSWKDSWRSKTILLSSVTNVVKLAGSEVWVRLVYPEFCSVVPNLGSKERTATKTSAHIGHDVRSAFFDARWNLGYLNLCTQIFIDQPPCLVVRGGGVCMHRWYTA